LSNDKGKVEISWTVSTPKKSEPVLKFRWSEKGGPAVKAPATRGFGTKLIERSLASNQDGTVNMTFAKTGVICIITTKVAQALEQFEATNLVK
jgi:two-component sensor histidine kinase